MKYNLRFRITQDEANAVSESIISDCYMTNQTIEAIELMSELLVTNLKQLDSKQKEAHAPTKKTN